MPLPASELTALIRQEALTVGFSAVGVCPAVSPTGVTRLHDWLDAGYAGEMQYLEDRREAYSHPQYVLEGVHSIVMLALTYKSDPIPLLKPGEGRVSRYAFGELDYHDWIHARLKQLKRAIEGFAPGAKVRGVVDTAPLLEREFAQQAGLGWFGKNTMLLNKQLGSLFFLSAILIDQPLVYDEPHTASHCGTCTACLDACPTDAFVKPHVLDATRCISYLTIELRAEIPPELRSGLEDWVFGCDVCQDVCPWNNKAPLTQHEAFFPNPDRAPLELRSLFSMTDDDFRARFRNTPLWRSRRRGILRNAAIVLGNRPHADQVTALSQGLNDEEWLVRGAAAWALGQHDFPAVMSILRERSESETDPRVQVEIDRALARRSMSP
ncbi:tRNA epoxyqueuosine(34) reductase QueG [Bremerella cremea]|uniref:tRNA epoxyqueuosine(34) reductase QueG n=1 Tax=Bremerella cremea TaxID=1031537 RepID=A0A368KXN3_9BACT|nr:tRNA epoxyqueuosine(34) reductase QueG [Bremerella cremea]RCS55981.1 tRNA epoxyqueuosine(34) reductase QueG [Bremerella cremea]